MNNPAEGWMSREMWVECAACNNSGKVRDTFCGAFERIAADPGFLRCPLCDGKGLIKSGITWADYERLKHALDRCQKSVSALIREAEHGREAGTVLPDRGATEAPVGGTGAPPG